VPFIGVAWSLSYEMFFYLAIPLVIALLRLRAWNGVTRSALFLGVATVTAVYCAINGGHIRLILFLSGMLLYEAMSDSRTPKPSSTVGLIALVVALLWNLIPADGSLGTTVRVCVHFATLFVFGLACFRDPSAWLPRAFSWTPVRWLGNMSYSYYLIHGIALRAGFLALSFVLPMAMYGSWFFWALLPMMFTVTLIVSAALFLIVERPLSLAPRRAKRPSPNVIYRSADKTIATEQQQAAQRSP
jgi:peptidoglycan/LPS O-acetylase OafA/YrhL